MNEDMLCTCISQTVAVSQINYSELSVSEVLLWFVQSSCSDHSPWKTFTLLQCGMITTTCVRKPELQGVLCSKRYLAALFSLHSKITDIWPPFHKANYCRVLNLFFSATFTRCTKWSHPYFYHSWENWGFSPVEDLMAQLRLELCSWDMQGLGFKYPLFNQWAQPAWGCPARCVLCWLHPPHPRNISAESLCVWSRQDAPCPVIKNGLEGRRTKLWKRQTLRWFHNVFIFRVSAHPKYSRKLLLLLFTWAFLSCPRVKAATSFQASILPLQLPLAFPGGIFIFPTGNCHQEADFPCQPLQLLFPSGSIRSSRTRALIEHTGETTGTSGWSFHVGESK